MKIYSKKASKASVWVALAVLAVQSLVPSLTVIAETMEETKDEAVVKVTKLTETTHTDNQAIVEAVMTVENTSDEEQSVILETNLDNKAKSSNGAIVQKTSKSVQVTAPKQAKMK